MSELDPHLLSTLLENLPVVTYVATFDERATLMYVSPQMEALTGVPAAEFLGADDSAWYRRIHPDDVDRVREAEAESYRLESTFDTEYRLVHLDGTVRHVWERDVIIRDEAGRPRYTQGIVLDVTSQHRAEAELRAERDRAQRYLDVPDVAMLAVDAEGRVTMLNRAGHEMIGHADGTLIGAEWFRTFVPDGERATELYRQALAAQAIPADRESELIHRDGHRIVVSWKMKILSENGRPVGLLCSGIDITERRRAQQQIAHMAYHDSLTGLPNRAMLRDHLDVALARAQRNGHSVALLYLDLDDFKLVNDGLGHAAGDELLRAVAARLCGRLRVEDLVAREGGDEFLVLLGDLEDDAELRALGVGETLVEALRPPFELAGTEFEVNGSVGISVFPRDAPDAEGLLAHADTAMYDAKAAGRGQVRVFRGRRHRSPERLALRRRLRQAIEQDQLVLHWQPIVGIVDGLLTGAEALVRWEDPQRGLLTAGDFVGDMDAAGLLEPLDEWVATALTAQRRAWQAEGLDPHVGFNLGPRALNPHRVDRILSRLMAGGLGLERVTIEISESEALRDDVAARAALERLSAAGLTLALDDFGVAYSSLSRLRDLPTEWIKVDRSFLQGVPDDPAATRVLDAILQLLDALGSRVIAEGVETAAQLEYLRARHCEAAQGYYLCPPQPAGQLEPLLRASPWAAAKLTAPPRSEALRG